MFGWALRQLMILGALAVMLYAVVGHRFSHLSAPHRVAAAAPSAAASPAQKLGPNTLEFHANKEGHVFIDGVVNGSAVRFMLDTGASVVALTPADAAAAGLGPGDLDYRGRMSTANGIARAAPVKLREIRIGQFSTDDVPAVVMDHLSVSLLGQSFLNRLDSYQMRGGVLTLNWY